MLPCRLSETLEEQNGELHMKINHLGQLAITAEDLKSENSRLKTCDYCKFEFIMEQNFKEHICKKTFQKTMEAETQILKKMNLLT